MKLTEELKELNKETIQKLEKEFQDFGGQLVLQDFEVAKFVGIELEDDDDFFYQLEYWGGKKVSISCVIGIVPLKPILEERKYNQLLHIWEINQDDWDEYDAVTENLKFLMRNKFRNCFHEEVKAKEFCTAFNGRMYNYNYKLCSDCGHIFDVKLNVEDGN